MSLEELEQFYLVGGTGLSLLKGHRDSIDIDLFTHQPFDGNAIASIVLEKFVNVKVQGITKFFLFTYIDNVKVDFVKNNTPLNFPVQIIEGIRIADERDIAALKLKAIFQRGSKKDFIDLYVLLQQYSVQDLIDFFQAKFPNTEVGQLLMTMYYFGDAEENEMPKLYINTNWEEIKTYISQKIIAYLKN
jgi:predicted nucleotidyltransferase component of viral defense system